ncbi:MULTISPECIES: hypothetical protein [unclassified Mucilaginibacter]|uniref:hypothetical protein n=1 Tax=unclassified Mucilaginibacter TaxID=2617802 RepID=UPI002AC92A27|nr:MULTISPECIES: hypothetical protein [unclassified Mucilaginibacter]MEB0263369.1 hypothetical protein [Mucilaginibacter sp. 10I4]MEB0279298.1 hypothetical protein [Mucilaginibacter sp. 10B2]MEB0302990.1 hypothetical protein [Mucilaginibacter sp. 5C4]WPX23190.1 hypothetical protein RHM67_18075 [Mucilaginibacter sp. 5C4]
MPSIKNPLNLFFWLSMTIILSSSCNQKNTTAKTWYYNEGYDGRPFFEKLDGRIKRLSISYSRAMKGDYNVTDFDEQGNMSFSIMKSTDIASLGGKTDTTVQTTKASYKTLYKNNQVVGLMQTLFNRYNFFHYPDLSKNYTDTVQLRYEIYKLIKSDTISFPDQHREPDIYTFKYDSSKRIIEENLFETGRDLPLSKNTYTYSNFDYNGNWQNMILRRHSYPPLVQGTFIDTVTRKIIYY